MEASGGSGEVGSGSGGSEVLKVLVEKVTILVEKVEVGKGGGTEIQMMNFLIHN